MGAAEGRGVSSRRERRVRLKQYLQKNCGKFPSNVLVTQVHDNNKMHLRVGFCLAWPGASPGLIILLGLMGRGEMQSHFATFRGRSARNVFAFLHVLQVSVRSIKDSRIVGLRGRE